MVLTIAPFWLGQSEQVQAMDAGQQLGAISLYFLGAALIIFPMFALLRVAAAKVYASAMRRSVELGETAPEALSPQEHSAMTALGLLEPGAPPAPRWQTSRRFGSWVKTMPFRFAYGFIAVLFYFAGLIAPLHRPIQRPPREALGEPTARPDAPGSTILPPSRAPLTRSGTMRRALVILRENSGGGPPKQVHGSRTHICSGNRRRLGLAIRYRIQPIKAQPRRNIAHSFKSKNGSRSATGV
ncbi:MAG: hypothetical protein R3F11_32415 [Verrucomicrobiales bacterium]